MTTADQTDVAPADPLAPETLRELAGMRISITGTYLKNVADLIESQGCKLEEVTNDWKHALGGVGSLSEQLRWAESRLEEYRKLCPDVKDLNAGEMVDGTSTITVGVGFLTKLMADHDERGSRLDARNNLLYDVEAALRHGNKIEPDSHLHDRIKAQLELVVERQER